MEEFQIANYGIGGQYNPHFDYFIGGKEFENNRIATWLGYISDVQGGGGTAFPILSLIVREKTFYSAFQTCDNSGETSQKIRSILV